MTDQEVLNEDEAKCEATASNENDSSTVDAPASQDTFNLGNNEENTSSSSSTLLSNDYYENPSMTFPLFVYWILPLFLIAIFSRKVVDTTIPTIDITKPIQSSPTRTTPVKKSQKSSNKPVDHPVQFPSKWPTPYRNELEIIRQRRRHIDGFDGCISNLLLAEKQDVPRNRSSTSNMVEVGTSGETTVLESSTSARRSRDDPARERFHDQIQNLRKEYEREPKNIFKAITLADAMRMYDLQFHEGGTFELEALKLYSKIVTMVTKKRNHAIAAGKATDECNMPDIHSVNDEVAVDYPNKSLDGLLCSVYTSKGKLYFMANMFERAVESYNKCLDDEVHQPFYLDALNARASSLIVLGKLEDAGRDLLTVIQKDSKRFFMDAFTGLARVLEAKEDAVPGGWDTVTSTVEGLIESLEFQLSVEAQSKRFLAGALNRLHHFLFTYHDKKSKNYPLAFQHLTQSYQHKLSVLPKWVTGSEMTKIVQSKSIFQKGFWPPESGTKKRTPIFIVGFVRSGSTLLERILDAHPLIAGTGENSVFNGRLGYIRDQIVQLSNTGGSITELTRMLADDVIDEMQKRHAIIEANTQREKNETLQAKPKRLVDKMLTNYYNVGFIQLLYPNALILHVAREPMDSVFSAYKHEFPSGTLDYTSDFTGLAELYHTYRDMMDHWEEVLPGRITHIRYEDMVRDFEGTARAIIKATGLPWDDCILEFHKKKHAVNTLSSTQVRKGVYTDSLKSWMRYEDQLQDLIKLIGDRMEFNFETSLPGYKPLDHSDKNH